MQNFRETLWADSENKAYKLLGPNWAKNDPFLELWGFFSKHWFCQLSINAFVHKLGSGRKTLDETMGTLSKSWILSLFQKKATESNFWKEFPFPTKSPPPPSQQKNTSSPFSFMVFYGTKYWKACRDLQKLVIYLLEEWQGIVIDQNYHYNKY